MGLGGIPSGREEMQRESVCRACSMLDPYMLPDLHTNIKHMQIPYNDLS